MRQSLISEPNFFGSWIQPCTKLVWTHALLILIMFIIKMNVYKMTCMIQYPCSKHASSPSLPHQAMLVYTCLLFIPSALSLTTLIFGDQGTEFLLQNVPTVSYKIVVPIATLQNSFKIEKEFYSTSYSTSSISKVRNIRIHLKCFATNSKKTWVSE